MSSQLIRDAEEHPDLFDLRLPVAEDEVAAVEHRLRVQLPPSFRDVLKALGQGSLFDNETLLGVHEIDEGVGDLERVNLELREKQDLPDTLVVFHVGTGGLHAFDLDTPGPEHEVVTLGEDDLARGTIYNDFEHWYDACLRAEYESLLGL